MKAIQWLWTALVDGLTFYERFCVDYERFSDVYERIFVDYQRFSDVYERIRVDYQRFSQKALNHPSIKAIQTNLDGPSFL